MSRKWLLTIGKFDCGSEATSVYKSGNLQQYLQAHIDVLSGGVDIKIPGREIFENVYAGEGVIIDSSSVIRGPAFIGDGTKIEGQARIDSFTVLGDNCFVGDRATVKRSVVWNGCFLGKGAALRGAVLASRVQVQNGAAVYEGAVIGSDSVIKENGVIKPDVKLWPHKVVEAGSTVQSSIVWGTRYPKKIFGLDGVTGLTNVEMTPEFAARMAASFASAQGRKCRLAVSSDSYPSSQMIKRAVSSGMQSVGAAVFDLGSGITPMHRFAVKALELDGGIHIKVCPRRVDLVTMVFINNKGGNISRTLERKVENTMMREDFKRADLSGIAPVEKVQGVEEQYIRCLSMALNGQSFAGTRLVMSYDRVNLDRFIKPVFTSLGIMVENIDFEMNGCSPRSWQSYREMLPQLCEVVARTKSSAGALIDHNGDSLVLVDEKGRIIGDDMLTALSALVILKSGGGPVVVPVTAPGAIEKMALQYSGKVIRTKTAVQDFVDRLLAEEGTGHDESEISQFLLHFDALGALLSIIGFARRSGLALGQLVDEIPAFYMDKKVVPVPWEAKGTVIRRIIEEPDRSEMELLDGVKVFHPNGWALVLPDPEEPVCRIYSEGTSMEIAESLADFYVDKIGRITGLS